MKKPSFSTILTLLLCAVLVAGAVCLGAVRGWNDQREQVLLSCVERHHAAGKDIRGSVEKCEAAVREFDDGLAHDFTGRIAEMFGVAPIGDSLDGLHAQLLQDNAPQAPEIDPGARISALMDGNIDTALSFGKVFLAVVLLLIMFGPRKRKAGYR